MKKRMLTMLGIVLGLQSTGQTFTAPVHPDVVYPTASTLVVETIQHTSNYSMEEVLFNTVSGPQANNLYVWGWGGINIITQPAAAVAWRRTDASGTLINQGYIPIDSLAFDVEVAFVQEITTNEVFVFAAYYRPFYAYTSMTLAPGHYYNIYRWTPTGLIPFSMNNKLDGSAGSESYGRISIDAIDLKKLIIVWQTPLEPEIQAILFRTDVTGMLTTTGTKSLSNVTDRVMPDVALSTPVNHPDSTKVHFVFVKNVGTGPYDIEVRNCKFNTAYSGGAIATTLVDLLGSEFKAGTLTSWGMGSNFIHIDAPDHLYGEDNWSYIYCNLDNRLRMRTRTAGTNYLITLTNLLEDYINTYPTIAYSNTGRQINYGWSSRHPNANYYVGVTYSDIGVKIGLAGTYKKVTLLPPPGTNHIMAFSKQNDRNKNLFAAYPTGTGIPATYQDMTTKLVPWGATSFRPTNIEDNTPSSMLELSVSPNPFTSGINLSVTGNESSSR